MSAELLGRLFPVLSPEERTIAVTAVAKQEWNKVAEIANRHIRELREENDELNAESYKVSSCRRQAEASWQNAQSDLAHNVAQTVLCC